MVPTNSKNESWRSLLCDKRPSVQEVLFHVDFYLSCQVQSVADHFGKEMCDDIGVPVPVDQKALPM